ncbi:hypothetical protein VTH06DRAFT_8491 [Thermothelomyces fergusii]
MIYLITRVQKTASNQADISSLVARSSQPLSVSSPNEKPRTYQKPERQTLLTTRDDDLAKTRVVRKGIPSSLSLSSPSLRCSTSSSPSPTVSSPAPAHPTPLNT